MKQKAEPKRTDLPIIEKYLNKKGVYCPHLSNLRKAEICPNEIVEVKPKRTYAYAPFSVFRPNNRVLISGIPAKAFILADGIFSAITRKDKQSLKNFLKNEE